MEIFLTLLGFVALIALLIGLCSDLDGDARRATRKKLLARAEQQHAALMRGDDRLGTYGRYPPATL